MSEKTQLSYVIQNRKKIEKVEIKIKQVSLSNKKITRIKLDTCGIWLTLKILDISFNKVAFLPEIMSLEELYCGHCELTNLPVYLPHLKILHCSHNKIQEIETYPKLIVLNCSHNEIKSLSSMPNLLQLDIDFNPIREVNCRNLVSFTAVRCPLVILHRMKTLTRQIGNRVTSKEIIDSKCPFFIDWRIGKCKNEILFMSIFPNNCSAELIYNYLFK